MSAASFPSSAHSSFVPTALPAYADGAVVTVRSSDLLDWQHASPLLFVCPVFQCRGIALSTRQRNRPARKGVAASGVGFR
jgi:hypothetical protein